MNETLSYSSAKTWARITGGLYLIIIICGMFSEMFVRAELIVPGDAAATAANITSQTSLFRLGFISDLFMVVADVAVALSFYVLLKPVNQALSLLAAFFRLVQSTILGMNLLNYFNPLILLGENSRFYTVGGEPVTERIMFYLDAHAYGYLIALVFFALSCFILGYLMIRSAWFPDILGILLMIAAAGYLIDSFTNFLFPEYSDISEWVVVVSALVAELGLCLYLLIWGVQKSEISSE